VDYFDAGAALGPVVVLAAWALDGLLLLMVVTGNRRRARPAAALAEQAGVSHSHGRDARPKGRITGIQEPS
jgi:hypothetical protein